jgi:3-oxoacyl-[acyl-carrier protein] reductase
MNNFKGKSVLLTGATGGIGEEIAKKFIECGAYVILSGTNNDKLEALSKKLGDNNNYVSCNLSDEPDVEALFEKAEDLTINKQIDILVCNAGVTCDNLILRMKNDEFSKVIDINLKSTFILNRNAIKKMMRRKYGRIINISSVVALSGNPGQANYVASKAGVIGMTKSLAQEVASRSITINCIAPGFIESPMTDVLNDNQRSQIMNKIPAGRMGKSSEIANSVIFLASEESSYITGHTLSVNGGMFMN